MKVMDLSPISLTGNLFTQTKGYLKGVITYGFSWVTDIKAQETTMALLGRVLDRQFFLLRNASLVGLDVPIPLILIGPPGLYVIYACGDKGVFRAKNASWAVLDRKIRKFRPAEINLITLTQLMAQAVDKSLNRANIPHPEIQPALFFADPGTHVDSVRPAVRILMRDGLERFVSVLISSEAVLTAEQIQELVDELTRQSEAPTQETENLEPDQGLDWLAAMSKEAAPPARGLGALGQKLRFSRKQWVLLGLLIFFQVLILIAFLVVVLVLF